MTRMRRRSRSIFWRSATRPTPERDPEEIYDLPPLDEVMAEANMLAAAPHSPWSSYRYSEPDTAPASEPWASVTETFPKDAEYSPVEEITPLVTPAEPPAPDAVEPVAVVPDVAEPAAADAVVQAPLTLAHQEEASEPEPDKDSTQSHRRKRQQQKSARARKDKLRSSSAGPKLPPPPLSTAARARASGEPHRLAGFTAARGAVRTCGFGSAALAGSTGPDTAGTRARDALLRADSGRPAAPAAVSEHDGPVRQTVCTTACAARTARRVTAGSADRACERAGEGPGPIPPSGFTPRRSPHAELPGGARSVRAVRHARPRAGWSVCR